MVSSQHAVHGKGSLIFTLLGKREYFKVNKRIAGHTELLHSQKAVLKHKHTVLYLCGCISHRTFEAAFLSTLNPTVCLQQVK